MQSNQLLQILKTSKNNIFMDYIKNVKEKNIFTITDRAAKQIKQIITQRTPVPLGIRVGVKQRGCSGNAYTLEYVDEPNILDKTVCDKGLSVYIDPKALLFVIGTEMDYVDTKLESGFTFKNPNEKGRCGCGESFHV